MYFKIIKRQRSDVDMPWVDKEKCTGCGTCIEECPVGTISMVDEKAEINMDNCIRCGTCHGSCPEGAVEHDSKKIPDEVETNITKTKGFMDACAKYLGNDDEKQRCLARMMKYFNKEKIVAEKTLERLQMLKEKM